MAAIENGYQVKEKIAELSQLLLDRHPKMPVLLRDIHQTLRQYPEQVTLLSEEELSTIVNGLKVQTGVEFAASALKGTGQKSAVSKIKSLGADAF